MNKPIAVLLSDVHYDLATLAVADAVTNQAVDYANKLDVVLVITGDLHNTKANLRGECVKAIIATLSRCRYQPIVLIGNHDLLNEKSSEHSLEFLKELAHVIDTPTTMSFVDQDDVTHKIGHFIPYHHNRAFLLDYISKLPNGIRLIMHQGLNSAMAGEYIQDKSALLPEELAGFHVISGHYHRRQHIQLPSGGTFDYVGNPYTSTFAEVDDPPKGFQVLYEDGSLEFIPTNVRKHVKMTINVTSYGDMFYIGGLCIKPGDLVWIKVEGPSDGIAKITKRDVAKLIGVDDFRFDVVPDEVPVGEVTPVGAQKDILDAVIYALPGVDDIRKTRLKGLWKDLLSED